MAWSNEQKGWRSTQTDDWIKRWVGMCVKKNIGLLFGGSRSSRRRGRNSEKANRANEQWWLMENPFYNVCQLGMYLARVPLCVFWTHWSHIGFILLFYFSHFITIISWVSITNTIDCSGERAFGHKWTSTQKHTHTQRSECDSWSPDRAIKECICGGIKRF